MFKYALCLAFSFFCSQTYAEEEASTRFDVAAKRIAGIFESNEKNPEFQEYSRFIGSAWNRLCHDSLDYIPSWAEKHLNSKTKNCDTLFYPFGGPDIAYAVNFFPNVSRYILVGLEPLGNFDHVENRLKNVATFESFKEAFSTYFRKGYFVTSEMQTQLSNSAIRGGLNLILFALARMNFNIISVESCCLNTDGNLIASEKGNVDCVKIICEKNSSTKEIYYVRTNLNNKNGKLENLFKFVSKFEFSTFIKSASYALHDRNFSNVRNFILDRSYCILQDDTGVPFYFFRKNWDIHIFGTYTEPTLPVFQPYKQNSLKEYFATHEADPITFPIGYGYVKRTPNLVFAESIKKKIKYQLDELKNQLEKKPCGCSKES